LVAGRSHLLRGLAGRGGAGDDPGDVDNALDQLAARVKTVEVGGGGGTTTGLLALDTTLNGTYTIPSDHETIAVDEIYIQSGSLTVTGRLCIIESEVVTESAYVGYDPDDTSKWGTIPHNADAALNLLALRVKTIEDGGGGGSTIAYHKWDSLAPPASPSASDDEFDDATFDSGNWTLWDHGSNSLSAIEDDQGLLLSGDGDANEWMGIYRTLPSGDFSVSTKVVGYSITENDSQFGLALFENGSDSSADFVYLGFLSGVTSFMVTQTFTDYTTFDSQLAYEEWGGGTSMFLRIRRNGTTYFPEFSNDGEGWFNHPGTFTLGYTPSHMGLVMRRTTGTATYKVRSKFFRYVNTDVGLYTPISGRRLSVLT
jgi:hypothetical protein